MKPKINKESLEKVCSDLYDIRHIADWELDLTYKSPIQIKIEKAEKDFNLRLENAVYNAVLNYEIIVDKDELIKALRYDRDQYIRGYWAGYTDGAMEPKKIIPNLRNMINDINNYLDLLEKKYGGGTNGGE